MGTPRQMLVTPLVRGYLTSTGFRISSYGMHMASYQIWAVDADEYIEHSSLGPVNIIIRWTCNFAKHLYLYLWMDYCHKIWTEAIAFQEDLFLLIASAMDG